MRRILLFLFAIGTFSARGAHSELRLILDHESARPGETVTAGLHFRLDKNWHTFWKNPGTFALPTTVDWQLSAGVTVGDILWPLPAKFSSPDETDYIYTNEVILLAPLKLPTTLPSGKLLIRAKVAWQECEQLCVQSDAQVEATLSIGAESQPSKEASLIASWAKKVPLNGAKLQARALWEAPAKGDTRPLMFQWNAGGSASEAEFFPDHSEEFEVQGPVTKLPSGASEVRIRKEIKKLKSEWPRQISGVLVETSGAGSTGYEVNLSVQSSGPAAGAGSSPAPAGAETGKVWLLLQLAEAFLGGLILNVMPCVLPVIALKVLGFVGQAKDNPRRVRLLGLIYGLGVLVSFLGLAGLVIAAQAFGREAGWGMQFGNPQFVIVMIVLVTLVALNLFGIFEVNLGGRVIGAAGELASRHGGSGAFFNGVLATVLATPCTAPFLSPALGYAFTQPPAIILLFLATVGLGLATPYIVLSWHPAWLKFLPKPGAWMEKFKILMGFPMLATAFWLSNLMPVYYGVRAWWLGAFLVLLALAAWLFGEFVQRGRTRRGVASTVVVVLLLANYALVLEGQLDWRSPQAATNETTASAKSPIAWEKWSEEAVGKARSQGRPVLIDFTALWCATCNVTVKPALEDAAVAQKLAEINGVAMMADYTKTEERTDIKQELKRLGRAGVPLVLVYPKNPNDSPFIVREPLPLETPSHYRRLVLDFLGRAAP